MNYITFEPLNDDAEVMNQLINDLNDDNGDPLDDISLHDFNLDEQVIEYPIEYINGIQWQD